MTENRAAQGKAPYECHVFVCVNEREGGRKSCGGSGSKEIRLRLKDEVKKRWPSSAVRVSQSLCMGLCKDGPNVVIYPQGTWFSAATLEDLDKILGELERVLGRAEG